MSTTSMTYEQDAKFDMGLSNDAIAEETLVSDGRADMTPSQHVEQRLLGMLKASPVMISQINRRMKPGPR